MSTYTDRHKKYFDKNKVEHNNRMKKYYSENIERVKERTKIRNREKQLQDMEKLMTGRSEEKIPETLTQPAEIFQESKQSETIKDPEAQRLLRNEKARIRYQQKKLGINLESPKTMEPAEAKARRNARARRLYKNKYSAEAIKNKTEISPEPEEKTIEMPENVKLEIRKLDKFKLHIFKVN